MFQFPTDTAPVSLETIPTICHALDLLTLFIYSVARRFPSMVTCGNGTDFDFVQTVFIAACLSPSYTAVNLRGNKYFIKLYHQK